jgi:hypothetical protein
MSSVEKVDETINLLIANLVAEYETTGWRGPSAERKSEIIKEIAKLRGSMNPQIQK